MSPPLTCNLCICNAFTNDIFSKLQSDKVGLGTERESLCCGFYASPIRTSSCICAEVMYEGALGEC